MKIILEDPKEYFPYIGHAIDHEKQKKTLIYRKSNGRIYDKENLNRVSEDQIILNGTASDLFRRVEINGLAPHLAIARDPKAVEVIVPRHRTLYDYTIGQPVHHNLINPEVMLLAGNNLFVSHFDRLLRIFGAIMFLREDIYLKRRGHKKVFLSQERYINEVFPAYLRQEMINGSGDDKIRRDFIMYPEQEKHPVTKKRGGGRTKTGKLRNLSHILFDKLKGITKDTDVRLYVTPVNVSFSKIPEAPFIVYPNMAGGIRKSIGYLFEQYFIYISYPRYSKSHPEAKLDVTINYGKPEQLQSSNFNSMRDLLKFSKDLKEKIGLLESIYPIQFLYRILDQDQELSLEDFKNRAGNLYNHYQELGIHVDNISGKKEKMLPTRDVIDSSISALNSNPKFHIKNMKRNKFLSFKNSRLFSHDMKVHNWYANNLRHLD